MSKGIAMTDDEIQTVQKGILLIHRNAFRAGKKEGFDEGHRLAKSNYSFTLRFLAHSGYFALGTGLGWFLCFIFMMKFFIPAIGK